MQHHNLASYFHDCNATAVQFCRLRHMHCHRNYIADYKRICRLTAAALTKELRPRGKAVCCSHLSRVSKLSRASFSHVPGLHKSAALLYGAGNGYLQAAC